tara:strand:- start:2429 stop:3088 length:660 start_codon:yes stop_codon:yes gene_type:complete
MPRDKHPRERQKRALKRRKPTKRPYDRILIVTEGSKTEPQYLEEIRILMRAAPASIRIMPSAAGTDPRQIVQYAEAQFLETKEFEAVYAVFDRDEHQGYFPALQMAEALNNKHRNDERKPTAFIAVPSVPSFELWILLHYQDLWAYAHRTDIMTALRVHLPDYQKGATGLYETSSPTLSDASTRAAQLRERHTPFTGTDPYTDMDILVDRLLKLRDTSV